MYSSTPTPKPDTSDLLRRLRQISVHHETPIFTLLLEAGWLPLQDRIRLIDECKAQ